MGIIKGFDCIICSHEYDVEDYGDNNCPNCGQKYVYDEGISIYLSEYQIERLRELKDKSSVE